MCWLVVVARTKGSNTASEQNVYVLIIICQHFCEKCDNYPFIIFKWIWIFCLPVLTLLSFYTKHLLIHSFQLLEPLQSKTDPFFLGFKHQWICIFYFLELKLNTTITSEKRNRKYTFFWIVRVLLFLSPISWKKQDNPQYRWVSIN